MPREPKFKPGDKVCIISPDAPTVEHFKKCFPHTNFDDEPLVKNTDIVTIKRLSNVTTPGDIPTYIIVEDNGMFLWDESWLKLRQTQLSKFLDELTETDNERRK